jgi:RNA polymerase sigma factor (sigma-70 family)
MATDPLPGDGLRSAGGRQTDAALIRASIEDPEAFIAVFRRHYRAVHAFAQRRVGTDLAEEVAAETFARAFAGRTSFRPVHEDSRPWLLGIATNVLRRHWRAERTRLGALARLSRERANDDGGIPIELDVAGALCDLPRLDREVLFLLTWADLSYEQIAVALALPIGTVRSRISRARRRLDRQLGLTSRDPESATSPRGFRAPV